jgi:hypothetical protein
MTYRIPALNGLRAFEAAARHLSFTMAASELGVTPGAVSQQVKKLEASLGIALFRRLPHGLLLTREGETYFPNISRTLEDLTDATEAIAPDLNARKFSLGLCPGRPVFCQGNGHVIQRHSKALSGRSKARTILRCSWTTRSTAWFVRGAGSLADLARSPLFRPFGMTSRRLCILSAETAW